MAKDWEMSPNLELYAKERGGEVRITTLMSIKGYEKIQIFSLSKIEKWLIVGLKQSQSSKSENILGYNRAIETRI